MTPPRRPLNRSLPPDVLARLKRAESRQRGETRKRGLPAEPVSVEGLWLLQRSLCGCGCGEPLDIESKWDEKAPPAGYPIIAHRFARGSKGGHTIKNVELWRHRCNAKAAPAETSEAASVKRFTPDYSKRDDPKPKAKTNWPKRSLEKPEGLKFDWKKKRYRKETIDG